MKQIVNYVEQERVGDDKPRRVSLGLVRYASTDRSFQGVNDVPVGLLPQDLLAQKLLCSA